MKKKSDHRSMHHPKLHFCHRSLTLGLATVLFSALLLSACTTYRPLDRGASVPWAGSLAGSGGGGEPLDGNRYRVGQGDSLSRIASRYDIPVELLADVNNIPVPYVLYPGEVLRIPVDEPAPPERPDVVQAAVPPAPPLPPAAPAPVQTQIAPPPPPEPVIEGERYIVKAGESLAVIAVRFGLTLGDLVATNDIEPPYRINPGQVLIIPSKESSNRPRPNDRQVRTAVATQLVPPPPLSREGFLWPVNGQLIAGFDQNRGGARSGGVTIAARKGTPVRAADNGIVAYAGEALSGYGRMVMLRHAEGYVTLYAHNDVVLTREGDVVRRGQLIAEVGDSGDVAGSRLHFELRQGTSPIDPARLLAGLPGRQIGGL